MHPDIEQDAATLRRVSPPRHPFALGIAKRSAKAPAAEMSRLAQATISAVAERCMAGAISSVTCRPRPTRPQRNARLGEFMGPFL
jgi:hypothetical protein